MFNIIQTTLSGDYPGLKRSQDACAVHETKTYCMVGVRHCDGYHSIRRSYKHIVCGIDGVGHVVQTCDDQRSVNEAEYCGEQYFDRACDTGVNNCGDRGTEIPLRDVRCSCACHRIGVKELSGDQCHSEDQTAGDDGGPAGSISSEMTKLPH